MGIYGNLRLDKLKIDINLASGERRLAMSGLDIRLVGAVARGASRFENLLAPQKTNWPLPQNETCAMKKIFA